MKTKLTLISIIIGISILMISCTNEDDSTTEPSTPGFRMIKTINSFYNEPSGTWDENDRLELNYDSYGRIQADSFTSINGTGVFDEKETFSYENNSKVIPFEYLTFDQSKDWSPDLKSTFIYENDKTVERIIYDVHGNGALDELNKHTYIYENNLLTQKNKYTFNSGTWEPSHEFIWVYSGDKLSEYFYEFVEPGYEEKEKITYTWNGDELEEEITYIWNGDWTPDNKMINIYENGNLSEKKYYFMYNDEWVESLKYLYQFENNHLSSQECLIFNGNEWIPYYKRSYEYDSDWNSISDTYLTWISASAVYIPYHKAEYIYEAVHGNYTEILKVFNPEFYYTGMEELNNTIPTPTKGQDNKNKFRSSFVPLPVIKKNNF